MNIDFLHIGLHKTASTWLQKVVFDNHPDLLVFQPATRIKNSHKIISDIYRAPSGQFQPDRWWDDFNRETEGVKVAGKTVGISYEILAGDMIHGRDAMTITRRCKKLFGSVKAILVLRHPVDFVNSMYQQYVVQGGAFTLQQLVQDKTIPGKDICYKLNYQALVTMLREEYGENKLLVLPFELMRLDRYAFLRHIWTFLEVAEPEGLDADVQVRESVSLPALKLQRALNAAGIPMQQTRGRIRRLDARLLSKIFHSKYKVTRTDLVRWQPLLEEVLVDENYRLWKDELGGFNYVF
ncbi:hypothetical protein BMS3Bbin04_01140 [bacterium BMS3Bbin04]|nr:hypothetical protein BMS3Bbin04_01140 [bacterium BMS3Bbin04]